jgi:hypothetical protein
VRVLNLSLGQDTGGQAGRTAAAFDQFAPSWTYDARARDRTFYDLPHRFDPAEIRRLWDAADVVHLHNSTGAFLRYGRRRRPAAVIHYHGTAYRTAPAQRLARQEAVGALGIVSTLDLWAIAPDRTEWLPAPYDLDDLARYRAFGDPEAFVIAHAPTNRTIKGTAVLIEAVEHLRRDGVPVVLDIIERVDNAECLARKGRADVYVDQLLLGYGCNAIEAWGMGLPVVAGVDPAGAWRAIRQNVPPTTLDIMRDTFGELPFLEATESTLYSALASLVDPGVRAAFGAIGRRHAERFHAADRVVARLVDVYRRAYDGV